MKIVLFKSSSECYQKVFQRSGYDTIFIEPLQFEFVNECTLKKKLSEKHFNGIVLTSPRAIEAVSRCCEQKDFTYWRDIKVYGVGEASGNKIIELLNIEPLGLSSGNSEKLAEIILNENPVGSKFLFPSGNLKMETMEKALRSNGLSVDAVTVYKTKENELLKMSLHNVLQERTPLLLCFFSPSGVSFVLQHLQTMCIDNSNILYFAIGKTTSQKLEELGIKVSGIANKPSADDLLEAINRTLQC